MSLPSTTIHGGWSLVSFDAVDDAGARRQPLGARPRGLILYTADGWMSAQLAPDPTERAAEIGGYIAYGGRFHLDDERGVVRHEVTMSTMPELLAQPQLRRYRIDGDQLTLSTSTTDGTGTTHSTLIWQRAATAGR